MQKKGNKYGTHRVIEPKPAAQLGYLLYAQAAQLTGQGLHPVGQQGGVDHGIACRLR